MGCPRALLSFIELLCSPIEGACPSRGSLLHAYWIRSGTVQGDALSGSLFAAALAPCLQDLFASIEARKKGIRRARG
eukprot:6041245-Pyramimonas_sp.AAC.1